MTGWGAGYDVIPEKPECYFRSSQIPYTSDERHPYRQVVNRFCV